MKIEASVIEQIEQEISIKHINKVKHPDKDLYILNYTHKCQFDDSWNFATKLCRGLIVDSEYNIISNSFPKFFNFEQHEPHEIPNESFIAYEKVDGSMLISYVEDGNWKFASRGSFTSDQANWGMEIFNKRYALNNKLSVYMNPRLNLTYIFELVHPNNRIVVDYGNVEDIILLAIRSTETGEDYNINDFDLPFKKAKSYKFDNIEKIKSLNTENEEGFVIKFESGFRVKVKFDEYVRLHKLLTNTSSKSIYDCLSKGGDINQIIDRTPDEFNDFIKRIQNDLLSEYKRIENESLAIYYSVILMMKNYGYDRKTIAQKILRDSPQLAPIVFKMLDKKDHSSLIWKLIKPAFEKPFKEDTDA